MNGGANYHRTRLRRAVLGVEIGAGENSAGVSVGSEKVQTKNETATDFRL